MLEREQQAKRGHEPKSDTKGQIQRRRRELLQAATPGTGFDASVVFAGSSAPTTMKSSTLCTASTAAASAASASVSSSSACYSSASSSSSASGGNNELCRVCQGTGEASDLLTAAQAKAAAAWPEEGAYDCQVCFGDGEYCISSNCADRHFYCGDCIRGTLTAIIEMGQFPGAGPKTPAHPP